MAAADYPITTPFGYVSGYPLNNGYHKGEDRAMPVGTSVQVNGVQIGLSGNTGASTGPHLHIGHWRGATVIHPGGGGFTVSGATVLQTGNDSSNGNFVRVQDQDGTTWVYLHLSRIDVKQGQQLIKPKEEEMAKPSAAEVRSAFAQYHVPGPTEDQVAYYTARTWDGLLDDLLKYNHDARMQAEKQLASSGTELKPGKYLVK